ncbi:Pancreatic triacylglycerol lipase [Orchesella cincta]|uniref:Pancreatic triacylglycerol lipase n=1 Tax=Orchesella cincta TaxID=48709 RepID=A0A1D2M524_ORCCI|nr:Pancreatic triacylglycerol lipase [Orchesella cincta]
MSAYKSIISTVLFIVASVPAKYLQNTKDVVWFPNPNGDGTLLEANLTPDPDFKIGDVSDVRFHLFTGNNQYTPDELFVGDDVSLTNSHFIPNRPLKVLIHGFGGDYRHTFPWQTYQGYLKVDSNQNFIMVNWTVLADTSNYFAAAQNTRYPPRWVFFGGQVVGQIGSRVSEKLTRITALEPALPLFDVADLHNRTDPSDAIYVNVLHTSGILGFNDPCGTVPEFWEQQPGCGIDLTGGCAHERAPDYFLEALLSETEFRGKKCTSWNDFTSGICDDNEVGVMSYNTPETTTGVFYLRTNSESPYAQAMAKQDGMR